MNTLAVLGLLALGASAPAHADLPTVTVNADNTRITKSCLVVIPPGVVIADADGNGVIHIDAPDITVRFAQGSVLRGAKPGTPWNELTGRGIRVGAHAGVTLESPRVSGFKVGLWAEGCDRLTLAGGEFTDNFRQRLRSTPLAEDGGDWLSPHRDDNYEWTTHYGAAVYIRDADGITVRDVTVRRGQNGILLHRVNDSRIYDNDASFLSGWGLAMFRSSRNTISRNAFDFCVRGHVEGVYNRGQDSAGIICFEQNNNNVFAENSATHGGDGFFGFAGLEAIAESPAPAGFDHTRKGCNDNLLIDNDLSYAPAHGIEMTFSFGNMYIRNRLVENAICGIWGGYSQDTLIAENTFEGNGGMAYGLERGGVNIEHGSGNLVVNNNFVNNKCAVHYWWDPHGDFEAKPWGKANYKGVSANIIAGNRFRIDDAHPFKRLRPDDKLIVLQLRDDSPDTSKVRGTVFANNEVSIQSTRGVEIDAKPGIQVTREGATPKYTIPKYEVFGTSKPVGARAHLRGRDKIIMDEWGPWDHASPLLRPQRTAGSRHVYEIFGASAVEITGHPPAGVTVELGAPDAGGRRELAITGQPGVHAYSLPLTVDGEKRELRGVIVAARWNVTAFAWTADTPPWAQDKGATPEMLRAWRALAKSPAAVHAELPALSFNYGFGGPKDQTWSDEVRAKGPGGDRFGVIATAKLPLPKGKWKFATLSDDGIRVTIDGKTIIENWDWHGPERDSAVYHQNADAEVEIIVEHFEIDGYSVLNLDIEPAE